MEKIKIRWVLLFAAIWIITSNGFNSRLLFVFGQTGNNIIKASVYLYVALCVLLNQKRLKSINMHYKKYVIFLFLIPFLSAIPCYIYYGQSLGSSLFGTFFFPRTILLLYFVLHIYKVNERTLIVAFLFVSVILSVIMVFQQLFPDDAYFGILQDDAIAMGYKMESRNGLLRFRLPCIDIVMVACFYCWINLMKRINLGNVVLFILFVSTIYLTLTRQIIFASLFVILGSCFMMNKGIKGFSKYLVVLSVLIVLYVFGDAFFGSLLKDANENVSDSNYVRFLSYDRFWNDAFDSVLTFLFGHGYPFWNMPSAFSKHIQILADWGLYPSDVGFIGEGYHFGYINIFITYAVYYQILIKQRKYTPNYWYMYMIAAIICTIMLWPTKIVVWPFMLYICDLHMKKNKELS